MAETPHQQQQKLHEAAWPDFFLNLQAAYAELTEAQFELQKQSAKIEEARELFERLIESMSEALFVLDPAGTVTKVNRAATDLLGADAEQMVGRPFSGVVGVANLPSTPWQLLERAPSGALTIDDTEVVSSSHGTVAVSFSCALIRDRRGRITGLLVIAQDIRERKQTEVVLRRSEKLAATGRLAATIAHEINNPLESVTNLLYLARKDSSISPRTRKYLELAEQELDRVAHLAKQTLGFYRDTREATSFNASVAIEEVVALYSGRASSRRIAIKVKVIPDLMAHGYPGEFRQVLSNLVVNAVDAMQDTGGRLHVRARVWTHAKDQQGRAIKVTVADTGVGIPADQFRRIFEPFYTTKAHVGTGLGLWLSRSIIEKHGGTIRVRSRTATGGGTGSVFIVIWPASPNRVGGSINDAT